MHVSLSFLIGLVCAWAFKRRRGDGQLGYHRPLAGGVAAAFPHIDQVVNFIAPSFAPAVQGGLTWSVLLLPIWAFIVAGVFGLLGRGKLKDFYGFVLGSLLVSFLLALASGEGIRPFEPFSTQTLALNLFYAFDLTILIICLLTLVFRFIFKGLKRDLSRVGLVAIIVYAAVVASFHYKAESFAMQYVAALELEPTGIHALPQPISPMNWRLVVETERERLHDTMINLFREKEVETDDTSTRAKRIDALYKPLDRAVWRIYRRFGNRDYPSRAMQVQEAWLILQASSVAWESRFAVFTRFEEYLNQRCVRFRDLRTIGARRPDVGQYLVCARDKYDAGRVYRMRGNQMVLVH